MMKKKKSRQGLIYHLFRAYMFYIHDCFLYRKVYRINKNNVPANGVPVLLISNHQNCLCDPLTLVFTLRDRKLKEFVRADIFKIHPLITKALRYLGLSPAFRLDFDGKEALWENRNMFKDLEEKLLAGDTVLMYPEGRHQNKHWLGEFSHGYTKLAFETAALGNFEKDIRIVPCCNHYVSYQGIQHDVVVKFGTPVSLQPYYELYQSKPRTAQRQLNEVVREQVRSMMLHISDLENYKAIDFLRQTYGSKFAETNGFRAAYLPERLESDKLFVKKLLEAKEENEESVKQVFEDALSLERSIKKINVRDEHFDRTPGWFSIAAAAVALTAFFPVWLFSLWPNILIYLLPSIVMRRIKDKMFTNTFLLAISGLITMPLLYLLTFIITWIILNFWIALIYALALPWLGLFAHYYTRLAVRTRQNIRYRSVMKSAPVCKVRDLRKSLNERLNKLLIET